MATKKKVSASAEQRRLELAGQVMHLFRTLLEPDGELPLPTLQRPLTPVEKQARAVVQWLTMAAHHSLKHPDTVDRIQRLHDVLTGRDLATRASTKGDHRVRAAKMIREYAVRYCKAESDAERRRLRLVLAQHLALGLEPKLEPLLADPSPLHDLLASYTPTRKRGRRTVSAIMAELGAMYGAFGGTAGTRHKAELLKAIDESLNQRKRSVR